MEASVDTTEAMSSDLALESLFVAGLKSAQEGIVIARLSVESRARGVGSAGSETTAVDGDAEPIVVFANQACFKLCGYSAAELVGKPLSFLEAPLRPDPEPIDIERLSRELRVLKRAVDQRESCAVEIRHYRKTGEGFWCELKLSPIELGANSEEDTSYFIYFLRDISHKIANARKLKEQYQRLEQAQSELRQLAVTDGLTKIYNRRYFDQQYDLYWNTAMRSKMQLAIFLLDVDKFKKYNDRYGHQKGDEVLVKVAQAIQGRLRRATDLLARYGGEEFVVLIQDSNQEHASTLAEGILESIRELLIPHADSHTGVVTASIGFHVFMPSSELVPGKMLSEVDQALYAAKKQGRNAAMEAAPLVFPLRSS